MQILTLLLAYFPPLPIDLHPAAANPPLLLPRRGGPEEYAVATIFESLQLSTLQAYWIDRLIVVISCKFCGL